MIILFWLNKHRKNSTGTCPLMMRITYRKERINITLSIRITEKQWDAQRQKLKGLSTNTEETNNLLDTFKARAFHAYNSLLKVEEQIHVRQIAEKMHGEEVVHVDLMEAFDRHIKNMLARLGVDVALGTIIKYRTIKNKVMKFLRVKYRTDDIPLSSVDRKFITELDQYFRGVLKSQNNTVLKNMQQLKTVLRVCKLNDWMRHDPFEFYLFKFKETFREFLTMEEIQKLALCDGLSQGLEEVRDVFLFQCWTGLAHADLYKLKPQNVRTEADGVRWLYLQRTKTTAMVHVPLLPMSEKILNKYSSHAKCLEKGNLLPVTQNQPMNRALKKLGELAGITKSISTHMGRHTFATTVLLNNGVKIETVSRLLAHKNIRTTQIYGKITDMKVSADMHELGNKLRLM